jgi:hypothetical protein
MFPRSTSLKLERFVLRCPLVHAAVAFALAASPCRAQQAPAQSAQAIPGSQSPSPERLTEDLPPGTMQAKATTACLQCHEARIILQQRLSKGAWVKEVDKMTKWGAVVDASDHDGLVDYLSINFGPDRPPYQPARTSTQTEKKKSSGKDGAAKGSQ